jgi:hypothetical protein
MEAGILIGTQGKGAWIPTSVGVLMNVCCAAAMGLTPSPFLTGLARTVTLDPNTVFPAS